MSYVIVESSDMEDFIIIYFFLKGYFPWELIFLKFEVPSISK